MVRIEWGGSQKVAMGFGKMGGRKAWELVQGKMIIESNNKCKRKKKQEEKKLINNCTYVTSLLAHLLWPNVRIGY